MTSPNRVVKAEDTLKPLKWALPARQVAPQVSLPKLLIGLQLQATDEDRWDAVTNGKWNATTPASMQVIKSGATVIARTWTKRTAGAGASGIAVLIAGMLSPLIKEVGEPVTIALIGAGGLVAAAAVIAIAIFVKSDLDARGRATAARHAGRAEVAAAFLRATAALPTVTEESPNGTGPSGIAGALSNRPEGFYIVRLTNNQQARVLTFLPA